MDPSESRKAQRLEHKYASLWGSRQWEAKYAEQQEAYRLAYESGKATEMDFPMPNGKTIGECSSEEIAEAVEYCRIKAQWNKEMLALLEDRVDQLKSGFRRRVH